jgi:hypothetical protein
MYISIKRGAPYRASALHLFADFSAGLYTTPKPDFFTYVLNPEPD